MVNTVMLKNFTTIVLVLAAHLMLSLNVLAEGPIRLGAIASLTGPAGEQGKNWIRGAELAVDDLRKEQIAVELAVEDDQTNPAKAATAFAALASGKKVSAVIGGTWDFLAEALYPLALQFRIPLLTPTNPPEIFPAKAKENPFIFSNSFSLASEAKELRRLLRAAHPRSLALVYVNVPFGERHAIMLRELASELGIPIAFEQSVAVSLDNGELKTAALRVQKHVPDAVFIVKDYAGLDAFMIELERMRLAPLVLTTQHLDEAFTLSKNPDRYRRVYGLYPKYQREPFVSSFRAKYGEEPKVYAESGYDAVQFLVRALHAGKSIHDPDSQFQYAGLTGEYRLPPKGRSLVDAPVQLMAIRGGMLSGVTDLEEDLRKSLMAK